MTEKKIDDDYDMSNVTAMLKDMGSRVLTVTEREQQQQLGSMIIEYHTQAYERKIRVLSLDGGGERKKPILINVFYVYCSMFSILFQVYAAICLSKLFLSL
jgi:hypothetical protein